MPVCSIRKLPRQEEPRRLSGLHRGDAVLPSLDDAAHAGLRGRVEGVQRMCEGTEHVCFGAGVRRS